MERGLKAITVLAVAGAWALETLAAPPVDASNPATELTKPEPPVPPIEYIRAGARLFNRKKYELAGKYFEAAAMYRDQLSKNERIVLDEYRRQLDAYYHEKDHPRTDPGVVTTAGSVVEPTAPGTRNEPRVSSTPEPPSASGPRRSPATEAMISNLPPRGAERLPAPRVPTRFDTTDVKQKARWLLHEAREFIRLGNLDEAERKAAEAGAMDVKWGFFDDSPTKVTKTIASLRAKASKNRRTSPLVKAVELLRGPQPSANETTTPTPPPDLAPVPAPESLPPGP